MQDILVHSNSFTSRSHAVEYSARLAAAQSAALTALYVYPSPLHMMPAYGAPALFETIVEQSRKIEQQSLAAESDFVRWANGLGVSRAAWYVAEGFVPEALAHLGNWHDLLVLGRDDDAPWESAGDLGSMILRAGLPCLVVPPGAPDPGSFDCIALAWNGSQEALRAIHASRPLLTRAKRIVLLTGRRRDTLDEIGWRPAFDILSYLHRHDIEPERCEITADDAEAGATLLGTAAALRADLLVMGAYGRNRFSEWVFGGATRHALAHAQVPLLMRH